VEALGIASLVIIIIAGGVIVVLRWLEVLGVPFAERVFNVWILLLDVWLAVGCLFVGLDMVCVAGVILIHIIVFFNLWFECRELVGVDVLIPKVLLSRHLLLLGLSFIQILVHLTFLLHVTPLINIISTIIRFNH
jgi:hypothetical protein